jgi:two-component system phosphate regulon sensor histidine kinase PhoR
MTDHYRIIDNNIAVQILDALPDAIAITDEALKIQYLNQQAIKILGHGQQSGSNLDAAANTVARPVPVPLGNGAMRCFRLIPSEQQEPASAPRIPDTTVLERLHPPLTRETPGHTFRMLSTLGIGLILLDKHHHIQRISYAAQQMFSQSERILQRKSIAWLIPEFDLDLLSRTSNIDPDQPQAFSVRDRGRILAGNIIFVDTSKNGDVASMVTLFDVGPYQTRDTKKTSLLRVLVHDLTNPLNIALNFADLINQQLLTDDEVEETATIIVNHLNRIKDLLADVSLLERLGENIRHSFEPVALDALIIEIFTSLEQQATTNKVQLRLNPLPDRALTVHGNVRLLRQGIYNLVENAIKYTLPDGWVRITLHRRDPWIDLLVADNGVGIPPNKQRHVFSPFYRAKDPRMTRVPGTGLGLNLVQMIAEQHEGALLMHTVPDKGSIFTLRLRTYLPLMNPAEKR